jgi:hypothetical protein
MGSCRGSEFRSPKPFQMCIARFRMHVGGLMQLESDPMCMPAGVRAPLLYTSSRAGKPYTGVRQVSENRLRTI